MRPDQIADIRQPSDPNLHPDGSQIVFVVAQLDLEADWAASQIWRWDGASVAPFTAGKADKSPRWSPDGSLLAFLRAPEPGGKFQVAVMPTGGGEPTVITDFALGVSELQWSPDGRHLAIVAKEWIADWSDLDDDERKRRPRRITRLPYRANMLGWTHDRRNHVWLVDPNDATEPRCLTPGDYDESGIAWSPDGGEIAFLSERHPEFGLESGNQVFTVGLAGGEAAERSEVGMWSNLSFDGTARVLVEDRGTVAVYTVTADGGLGEVITGKQAITGISFTGGGGIAAYVCSTPTNPGELWRWVDGEATRLTDLNGAFEPDMVTPTSFTIEHEGVEIEGWIYLPPGDAKVPVLFNIHGGPATQYGWGFFDEFQVYVGAGYGVVATNPRGSSGYGKAHVQAVVEQWQTDMPPDLRDLLAAVDRAGEVEPRLDTDNVGVMGGSYGGLMTVVVTAADQRYKSAVAERGLYVMNTFAATADIGPWFTRMYVGDGALDSAETMWSASPLKGAGSITTPTLIVHAEDDFRCPIEQAEQLFLALLRNGTPTELLRFPGPENHEMSRSGKPKHRVERFEAILDWHGRYLRS